MKVVHFLNSNTGGSALSTLELIKELEALGVTSYLICDNIGDPKHNAKIEAQLPGRVRFLPLYWMNQKIRVKTWKRPLIELYHLYRTWKGYKYQKQIQSWIKTEKIQLIHTSTILTPEGAIAAKALNIPHIWHVRELIGPDKYFQFSNYSRLTNFIKEHADILVANSKVTENCLLNYFSKDFIKLIPNAIDVKRFHQKTHKFKTPIVVGMIGNVTSRVKNHALFIEVANFFKGNSNIKFEIYGKTPNDQDPYFKSLKEKIELLGLQSNDIEFKGFMAPERITEAIDILFHPTGLESFGRIFIEAMAAQIPVLGINSGGAASIIQDGINGFLSPEKDLDSICSNIQFLADNTDLRNKMGKAGRKSVLENYDLSILANRIKELYLLVLEKKQAAPTKPSSIQ